ICGVWRLYPLAVSSRLSAVSTGWTSLLLSADSFTPTGPPRTGRCPRFRAPPPHRPPDSLAASPAGRRDSTRLARGPCTGTASPARPLRCSPPVLLGGSPPASRWLPPAPAASLPRGQGLGPAGSPCG